MQPFNLGILKHLGSITRPGQAAHFPPLSQLFVIMLGKAQGCKRAWLRDRYTRGRSAKKRSIDAIPKSTSPRTCPHNEDLSLPEPFYLDNSSELKRLPDLKSSLKINILSHSSQSKPTEYPPRKNQTKDISCSCCPQASILSPIADTHSKLLQLRQYLF